MRRDLTHIASENITTGHDGGIWQFGQLRVVASWGLRWEHVSVSHPTRCPTWDQMHAMKQRFFHDHEAVMQIHPPERDYVNLHPFCLHLWRPQHKRIPLPKSWMVGQK